MDAVGWNAVQESVAVVDSSEDETTRQCLREICRNEMTDVADSMCMVIARLRLGRNVLVMSNVSQRSSTTSRSLIMSPPYAAFNSNSYS